MHKVEKCLDGPLLPQKKLRGKAEPRLVKKEHVRLSPAQFNYLWVV